MMNGHWVNLMKVDEMMQTMKETLGLQEERDYER